MPHPPVLIEDWLPIEAIGAESKRERGASSALPPLYFLHIWWARRPLTVSHASILGGVLPQWSTNWPEHLLKRFPGAGACDVFLMNRGLKRDSTFRAGLQALINAIPRTQVKGEFVRPEAGILDKIRLAFYADELTIPVEEEPELPQAEQLGLGLE